MQDDDRFDAPSRRVATVGGGAPSYRIGRKGLRIIEELSARGVAEATIAKALRMGKDAFRAVEHDRLVGVLREQAMAGQYVPAIFLLKARHGYREGDSFEANVNVNVNTGGVVVLPNRQSMEEFLLEHREAGTPDSPKRISEIEHIPDERKSLTRLG